MAFKELLGLGQFNITDMEIMSKIEEARRNNINSIEFTNGERKILLNLAKLSPDGFIRDDMYFNQSK